ncbi:MAG: serine hydrolase [Asgard group archaeon]|nr:serine hydrolase [Asgard group archaeon]
MSSNEIFDKMEGLIDKLMQGSKTPGLSISIIKDNKSVYTKGFGARDVKKNLPATENTLYGIGSCGKSFTALAIMQLSEKGLLSIDDPVSKYLPFKIGLKDNPILIKHLLSHSSGLPNLGMATVLLKRKAFVEDETFVPMSDFDDFMRFMNQAQDEILHKPGKRMQYCNAGYTLLGLIIEKVSGQSFEEYLEQNILKPLKMNRTTYNEEKFKLDEDHMEAYRIEKDKLKVKMHTFDKFIYASGGTLSSVKELENYVLMYLNGGTFKKEKVVSKESIDQLFEPRIKREISLFGESNYCFGWSNSADFFGETLISHSGSTALSSAYIGLIPKKKMAVIVAGNVGNIPGSIIAQFILASLLGKNPMNDHPVLTLDTKLGKLVGQYTSYKGLGKMEIIKKGGLLYIKIKDGDTETEMPLIPESTKLDDYKFYVPQGYQNMPCEFKFNKEKNRIDFIIERFSYHKIGPLKMKK